MEAAGVQPPSRARTPYARARDKPTEAPLPSILVGRGLPADLLAEWVGFVQSFDPVLQAHVPPEYPWFGQQAHVRAAALIQKLVAEVSGEVPTMFCAIQRNVKRGYGSHSHDLACGSPQLLRGSRRMVWREFRRVVATWPGQEQPGYWRPAMPGREFVSERPNDCRFRLTPIYGETDRITRYIVRYCLREDVDQAVEVLPASTARQLWAELRV
jgi:hypothetical protein